VPVMLADVWQVEVRRVVVRERTMKLPGTV
jgi:hypothetical protein